MVAFAVEELGDLRLQCRLHQQPRAQAGDFFEDLRQLPILRKQGVDLGADTVGGSSSNRHGRNSFFFADLQVVKQNLRPCSLFTPESGHHL